MVQSVSYYGLVTKYITSKCFSASEIFVWENIIFTHKEQQYTMSSLKKYLGKEKI